MRARHLSRAGPTAPAARWLHENLALWLGLGLLAALSLGWSLVAVPFHYLLPTRWAHPVGRWAITIGFRIHFAALSLLGACRFDLRAIDSLRGEGPLIIAPNHPSLLDAPMVVSRLPNLACIMKAEIVDNLFLGAGARLAGYIRNDAQLSMIKQAVAELGAGRQLLLFPEATRTVRWPFNPCKGATGLISARARVPVQTVLIETDSAYLTKGWPLWRRPAMPMTYRVRLGRRFDPPDQPAVLTAELERYFLAELRGAPFPFQPQVQPEETAGAGPTRSARA